MPVPGDAPVGAGGGQGSDGEGRWESSNEVPPPPSDRGNGGDAEDGEAGSGGNGEFEEALGDFDGAILSEREGAGERNPNLPRTGGGGMPGETVSGTPGSADGSEDPTDPSGTASGQEPVLANVPSAPSGNTSTTQSDPSDARDDDIIARQLREAAMAESDPELKAALWEEYERYKNN